MSTILTILAFNYGLLLLLLPLFHPTVLADNLTDQMTIPIYMFVLSFFTHLNNKRYIYSIIVNYLKSIMVPLSLSRLTTANLITTSTDAQSVDYPSYNSEPKFKVPVVQDTTWSPVMILSIRPLRFLELMYSSKTFKLRDLVIKYSSICLFCSPTSSNLPNSCKK